jgi:cytoskeletal protein RodZ
MTLDDIAAATKVSKPTLDHIEHNRFDRLAGGILTEATFALLRPRFG